MQDGERAAQLPDEESSSSLSGSHANDSSFFNDAFLMREERNSLASMLKRKASQLDQLQNSSKVNLPFEMLINKLVDSLAMPSIVQQKVLPYPV